MNIKSPASQEDWVNYFQLRWQVLRAPWQQPIGSEKDDLEFNDTTFHAMAISENNEILGVARLHLLPQNIAQVRYMAVSDITQGMGVGSQLLKYLENIAKSNEVKKVFLQSRENAVEFYKKHDYVVVQKSFLMYDQIQHYLMEKDI
jgi:N-acetylglutamate synthase-like GNAT family acetyltransferase